jgi:LmbE family N-acetylglucosaminyl deacetylase
MTRANHLGRHLFLSPHLDDAVLSCGAFIYELTRGGAEVEILTIFAGVPNPSHLSDLAKWFHGVCGLGDDAIEIRRVEDKNAARCLGAVTTQLHLLECLYRRDETGRARYLREDDIFQSDSNKEMDTLNEIVAALSKSVDLANLSEIYLPLGIGRHIDHLLLRGAVESLLHTLNERNLAKLTYYEDLPYACWNRDPNWQIALAKNLHPNLRFMDEDTSRAKIEAISLYGSQVPMLWSSSEEMKDQLSTYALNVGLITPAERFWIGEQMSTNQI